MSVDVLERRLFNAERDLERARREVERCTRSVGILLAAIQQQDELDAACGRAPILVDIATGEQMQGPIHLPPILDFGGRPESPELQSLRKTLKLAQRRLAEAKGRRTWALRAHDEARRAFYAECAQINRAQFESMDSEVNRLARGIADAAWVALLQEAIWLGQYRGHSEEAIRRRIQRCAGALGQRFSDGIFEELWALGVPL